jgi:alanine racemase
LYQINLKHKNHLENKNKMINIKHPAVIEISKSALKNNIAFMRKFFGGKTRISSVVKANAYGHGIEIFVPIAEEFGIDHFSVFSAHEAARIKEVCSRESRIMIMGWIDPSDLEWVISNGIEFYIFDSLRLREAAQIASTLGVKAKIHIELETGLNRTGFSEQELKDISTFIRQNSLHLEIKGLCTHYAGAESIANYYRIQRQIKKFDHLSTLLFREGVEAETRHTACSAAALSYPRTRMDMVRVGILQYGFWPTRETFIQYIGHRARKNDPLRRVLSWKSQVMTLKDIPAGEFISYGTAYLAQDNTRIAVIPVGYSSGFSRSLSNQGRVLIQGSRVAVIGLVNMNMLLADVTSVPGVMPGDEVTLIGRQQEAEITVASFGDFNKQLNYELLARLPNSIPRVIVD